MSYISFNLNIALNPLPAGLLHISTDWQLATDQSFSNIIYQSLNNTNDLLLHKCVTPKYPSVYFRARINTNYGTSDWSLLNINSQCIDPNVPSNLTAPTITVDPPSVNTDPVLNSETVQPPSIIPDPDLNVNSIGGSNLLTAPTVNVGSITTNTNPSINANSGNTLLSAPVITIDTFSINTNPSITSNTNPSTLLIAPTITVDNSSLFNISGGSVE